MFSSDISLIFSILFENSCMVSDCFVEPSARFMDACANCADPADTCAADSLCFIACPVNIDTGVLMKQQRQARHPEVVEKGGAALARHWGGTVQVLRAGLNVAAPLPKPLLEFGTRALRHLLPTEWMPEIGSDLPAPGRARKSGELIGSADTSVPVAGVYLEACINSLFGGSTPKGAPIRDVRLAMQRLLTMAGVRVTTPGNADRLCCGTVWTSKGLADGRAAMAEEVFDSLWEATRAGELPVICDAASCTHGLLGLGRYLDGYKAEQYGRIRFLDAVTFARQTLLPRLRIDTKIRSIAVHPTCSTVQIGAKDDLIALAQECSDDVLVPTMWGCCAFAGDRGMLHPELTASATRDEAREVAREEQARGRPLDAYVSANRTCEMGISRATGRRYRHVLEVLAELAAPAVDLAESNI
jgi:D-lactate dehydrogenase